MSCYYGMVPYHRVLVPYQQRYLVLLQEGTRGTHRYLVLVLYHTIIPGWYQYLCTGTNQVPVLVIETRGTGTRNKSKQSTTTTSDEAMKLDEQQAKATVLYPGVLYVCSTRVVLVRAVVCT